jgi:ATP-dependent Clp protease ATP-binding subunit ClpC
MPEENKNITHQFIICPVCEGAGKKKFGLPCPNCGGIGLGAHDRGQFYYWGFNLGKAVIKLSHLKRKANLIINFTAFIISLTGLGALLFWFWQIKQSGKVDIEDFFFWSEKHWLLFIFWLSMIAAMFVAYRLSEEEASKQKIKKIKYGEKDNPADFPNNWNELKRSRGKFKIEVSRGFSREAMEIVERAFVLADSAGHKEVKAMHLFFSLFNSNEAMALFSRLNIDGDKLIKKIKRQLALAEPGAGRTELSNEIKEVFVNAYLDARDLGLKKVKPLNFILPCMAGDKNLSEILYDLEIDRDKINNAIQWFLINDRLIENYRLYRKAARYKPASSMDRAYTAVATPVLNHFARDLTIAAKWGRLELCVGRDNEIEKIFQAMESGQSGVILTGPEGVGKRAVIGGIAQLMVEEDVPEILRDKRLVELDVARLLSGAAPAQAEERLLIAIDEVIKAGNIILYIDNIENLIGITAGAEESLDLSEVLAGALERRSFYCLASATNQNYAKYIEDKPIGNVMSKVEIEEPAANQAIQIIESKTGALEGKYKVYFSYNAIESAVKLASKYIHDKYLPAKAVDILESVAVKASKTKGADAKGAGAMITENDIAKIISEITRIPITKVTEKESQTLLNLEKLIHERMVDQEEAVKMVAASLRRARAELREGKRPIANFLFLGPTGVGKTELAKTVSEVYFGKEDYMIRLDMSEYQNKDSLDKMLGNAEGARGYLTEAVRKAPFSLVLLDEFEKAHPDILNLFLQVMDDGRLTDGQGRTIDFTNSIIIATSNAGALFIQEQLAGGGESSEHKIEQIKETLINEHLNKILRPELINRFDGVIVFKPLSMEDVVAITKLMLNKIGEMLKIKGIGLRCEEEGARKLAAEGFDPKFGARPLRRLLQEKIYDNIANKILADELKRRDTVVIGANAEISVEKRKEL